jgi:hypothetical protein
VGELKHKTALGRSSSITDINVEVCDPDVLKLLPKYRVIQKEMNTLKNILVNIV